MVVKKPLKISYCTTCMGRAHQLLGDPDAPLNTLEHDGTLRRNLEAEKDNPNVEFVILSYGKDPQLDQYMQDHYMDEIQAHRIKYVVYPDATHFQMAHAKNMAHRMASGDVLVNLDADNVLEKDTAKYLQQSFAHNPHQLITHIPASQRLLIKHKLDHYLFDGKMMKQHDASLTGRIAISTEDFIKLKGYDEDYTHWGGDDLNFAHRAYLNNIHIGRYPDELFGQAIPHSDEQRLENLSLEDQEKSQAIIDSARQAPPPPEKDYGNSWVGKARRFYKNTLEPAVAPVEEVNKNNEVGCGAVYVNFLATRIEIPSLAPQKSEVIMKDDQQTQYEKDWALQKEIEQGSGRFASAFEMQVLLTSRYR